MICMSSTWFKEYKLYIITMPECRHLYILDKLMINENYKFSWDFYPHLSKSLKYLNVSLYYNYGVKKSNLWVLNFCLQLVSCFYHVWIRLKNTNSKFREKKMEKNWKKNGKKNPGFGTYFWKIFLNKKCFLSGKKISSKGLKNFQM